MIRSRRSGGIRVHISVLNTDVGFSDTADSWSHEVMKEAAGGVICCAFRAMTENDEEEEEEGDVLGASMATG